MRKSLPILAAMVLCTLSCREPVSIENFVKNPDGPWSFKVDMTDSTRTYDIWLYTRTDTRPSRLNQVSCIPLDMKWTSPEGKTFSETVFMPVRDSVRHFFYSGESSRPYRTGLSPVEHGIWSLEASVPDSARIKGFRGLGIRVIHESLPEE